MLDIEVINQAKEKWNISENILFIRHVANYIYFAPKAKLYIRITDSKHRTQEQVDSELHWMNYLKAKGVHFAHPVKSMNSHLTENIHYGKNSFTLSVFNEAVGEKLLEKNQFTEDIFFQWGKTLGSLHKYTKEYTPHQDVQRRKEWNNDEYHLNIHKHFNFRDGKIYDESIRIEELFNNLSKDKGSYGLIHADFHTGNFHVDNNQRITLFDFDDCGYHWFAYDIATIFWSIEEHNLDWHIYENSFFNGYQSQNILNDSWYTLLPDFYNYRMILIHAFCKESLSTGKLDTNAYKWMNKTMIKTKDYFSLDKKCPFFFKI
jgi:Ser/Thr protein kinase RdoA (MazF antagonist)